MRFRGRVLGAALLCGAFVTTTSAQSGSSHAARTPWGDPDLQGNYTNLSEAGTPMERPKEFEGRNLNEVAPAERARIKKESAERLIGRFLGPTEAPDNWWQPAYGTFAERGAQLWFVVDPADGKIPPLTPEARARQEARAEARRKSTRGPADSWTDRSLYDRCITRGYPASGMPSIYGNAYQIVQAPGYVAIVYEMIHETRVIPLDNRPHVSRGTQLDMGVAKIFRLGKKRLDIGVDGENLLNTNYTTTYDNTYQYSAGNTARGGTWNNPTVIYTPRYARLNLTVSF